MAISYTTFVFFIAGRAFALLTVAMVVRLIVTFSVVSGNKLSIKDKIFVAIAWSPKATVQVRIRPVNTGCPESPQNGFLQQEEINHFCCI